MIDKRGVSRASTPIVGSTTANWQSGAATSGAVGADLVTFGFNGLNQKVLSLDIDISALTTGAMIYIRMYKQVNGAEKRFYFQPVVVPDAADPDASGLESIPVVNGDMYIHEAVRVEITSDTVGDNARAIGYDLQLQAT